MLHTPEGVKDFLWKEASAKEHIEGEIKELFKSYGYQPIETPTFEYLDIFTVGESSFQKPTLYQWVNRQGELVALRSDMTRAIARVVATQNSSLACPQRYMYVSNNFRYPERYQGKMHEFTQAGVELVGLSTFESDAEVINLAICALLKAGIQDFTIHLGSAAFLASILEDLGLDQKEQETVYLAIDQKDAVSLKGILDQKLAEGELKAAIFSLIETAGTIELIRKVKEMNISDKTKAALLHLEEIYAALEDYKVHEYVLFDLSILSYASYYTGMMFQVFTQGVGTAVAEGGRYDKLLKEFGIDLPAVGFGINTNLLLQKIQQLGKEKIASKKTLIAYTKETRKTAFEVAKQFRTEGLVIENSLFYTTEETLDFARRIEAGGILYFKDETAIEVYNIEENTKQIVSLEDLFNRN